VKLVEAENGQIALEKLNNFSPDLILLDLMMPKMDGFDFIEEYRKHPDWHSIPIVVVTAKILTKSEKTKLEDWTDEIYSKLDNSIEQVLSDVCRMLPKSV
jgi:CheY-like chemotaxis protein